MPLVQRGHGSPVRTSLRAVVENTKTRQKRNPFNRNNIDGVLHSAVIYISPACFAMLRNSNSVPYGLCNSALQAQESELAIG